MCFLQNVLRPRLAQVLVPLGHTSNEYVSFRHAPCRTAVRKASLYRVEDHFACESNRVILYGCLRPAGPGCLLCRAGDAEPTHVDTQNVSIHTTPRRAPRPVRRRCIAPPAPPAAVATEHVPD